RRRTHMSQTLTADQRIEVPRRFMAEVFNGHDAERARDFFTADASWHGPSIGNVAGVNNIVGLLGAFIGALSDIRADEQDVIASGDLGALRLRVTDGVYQAAFLTTPDGVILFDAPPSIGHNLQRAIDEIAQANDVSNKVTYLVHTHHHADHGGASSIFGKDVVRIGHEETRRLLLRDDDPARPAPEETFSDRRTIEIGGERIELAWHGANHTPDNSVIHFPEHDALMMVDIVNVGWVPVYGVNL